MSFSHEALAALPVLTDADKALIRAMCTRRFAYSLSASELASDFVAVDADTGVVPLYIIQNGTLFAYDAADATTVGDGTTCLVTSDGKRFKSGSITAPWSVLTKGTTAQPASPSVGDNYLIPTAATGTDWSGKDGKIGMYLASGWKFATVPIGRELYVQDEDARYYRNASGVWTSGIGTILLGANSVNLTNVRGAKASFTVKVENQTTNAEPASPVAPTAYIIGPSPTGTHWAGNAGKLAICLTDGTWTIIAPDDGDSVYDKSQKNAYRYSSATTAWVSSVGAWKTFSYVFTQASAAPSTTGSGFYTYSVSTAPTQTLANVIDPATITYTARSGASLRFKYRCNFAVSNPGAYTCGLYRDSDTNALAWDIVYMGTGGIIAAVEFVISAADASSHTYKIGFLFASGLSPQSFSHRLFQLEEAS